MPIEPVNRELATMALDSPVSRVRLVSPARARALEKLGIHTVRDLVTHFPRNYLDMSRIETCQSARIGEMCTIRGHIHNLKLKKPRPHLSLVEITVVDNTGTLLVTAFRQPWLMDSLKAGDVVALSGKVTFNYGFKRMTNPFIEVLGEGDSAQAAVIPIHGATEKLSAAWVRRLVSNGLQLIEGVYDPLPLELRLKYKLMSRNNALHAIHFPSSMREAAQARRRLAYEELLLLELHLLQEGMKRAWGKEPVAHVIDGSRRVAFELSLPFTLTDEQQQARDEILAAMAAPVCANHLLLGDVGTGKTVVAGCAVAAAADTGGQTLFLAPTEVLAQQHAAGLGGLLEGVGVRVGLLTGSTSAHERAHLLQQFAAGELDMLVGTHALLSDDVVGKNVTLVVIDEQQRFGVNQRAALLAKGEAPDAIYLTATPIPRSMALAMFGNLTLSYLKKRPKAGVQRSTKVVARELRGEAFEAAREALERGEQVYVVCPLIGVSAEERDASSAGKGEAADAAGEAFHPTVSIEDEADYTHDNVGAAVQEAERLSRGAFAGYEVALLHGGMSPREKHEVMERFRAGEVQVLVATTVIEVGVDVPNATIMIVEDADRFGLSQLHQLRGRVGRGSKDAQVFLLSASQREESLARLRAMETTDDGFELATFDLSLRREGDILGNRQSGASSLKMVNITKDGAIVEAARSDAHDILAFDPQLEDADHRALARELRLVFGGTSEVVGG